MLFVFSRFSFMKVREYWLCMCVCRTTSSFSWATSTWELMITSSGWWVTATLKCGTLVLSMDATSALWQNVHCSRWRRECSHPFPLPATGRSVAWPESYNNAISVSFSLLKPHRVTSTYTIHASEKASNAHSLPICIQCAPALKRICYSPMTCKHFSYCAEKVAKCNREFTSHGFTDGWAIKHIE
jgi:hypothetical protein